MLTYRGSNLIPVNYTNSDFMSNMDSRKSISRYVFTLGEAAVSWRSIKQQCIANSTTEAEYVAATEAAKEEVQLKKFLLELVVVPQAQLPIIFYCDNNGPLLNLKIPEITKMESTQNANITSLSRY